MYSCTYDDIAERYIDTVYRLALARSKSRENAEDITQEVFLKLIGSRKRFESETHLKAWLLRVTINCSKDMMMSAWHSKTGGLKEDIPAPDGEESGLYEAVMSLPAKYRTVIHLHYYEGYSVEEIAGIVKARPGTVKSQLHRGRELLKAILEEVSEDGR